MIKITVEEDGNVLHTFETHDVAMSFSTDDGGCGTLLIGTHGVLKELALVNCYDVVKKVVARA